MHIVFPRATVAFFGPTLAQVEYIDEENKVAVYLYQEMIDSPIEVCSKLEAKEKYNVIGELDSHNDISLYDKDDNDDDDYSEFSLVDEEEA